MSSSALGLRPRPLVVFRHSWIALLFATAAQAASLVVTTATLPASVGGVPYSQTIVATGGTAPYKWTLQSGGLPPGLALSTAGVVSGTPSTASSWVYSYPFSIYIKVTDAKNATAYKSLTLLETAPAASGGGSSGGTTTPPPPSTYTVTVTGGTANGVASGSFAPGATVTLFASPAPAGQYFKQWSGNAAVANSFGTPTTFTMPSSNVTETASFYTPAPIPQPVATHPRLWITPVDLPKFQSWAVASNPVYAQGLVPLLNTAIANYNSQFFPGGQPAAVNPDLGDTQGYQGLLTEQHALIFALHSLIDPNPANRILHSQRARNLIMVAMNEAAKGALPGAPFRDPLFSVYNRANFTSEAWPLVVDWIYSAKDGQGNDILTAADKATIRTVFLRWSNECLNAYTTGGDHPAPVGTTNSTILLGGGSGNAYRMASNNYYLGHARLLTLMSLCIDPADDPAITPGTPDAILGNTLRSYIGERQCHRCLALPGVCHARGPRGRPLCPQSSCQRVGRPRQRRPATGGHALWSLVLVHLWAAPRPQDHRLCRSHALRPAGRPRQQCPGVGPFRQRHDHVTRARRAGFPE